MPYVNLRPSQVILDPENPRLPDGTSSDREAINRLLDDGAEALVNLARDMARTGQTNPAELPIAVKSGNKYLILEGNRRFAALKLLDDPALADDEAHQKSFRRAAALGTPPKKVFTLVTGSRDEAEHWIVLRHTGENNGTGVKRWSAAQTATHRRRANRAIDSGTFRSMVIADDLEEAYTADDEIVGLVRQIRRGKLTNIGRFFSSDVMSILHFTLSADNSSNLRARVLLVRHPPEQLRDFFATALKFILDNSVDAYKNARVRSDVLRKFAHLLPDPALAASRPFQLVDKPAASTSADTPQSDDGSPGIATTIDDEPWDSTGAPSSIDKETTTDNGDQGDKQPKKKGEARPERTIFQGLRLPHHPERVQRLLKECRSIAVDDYPGIACVMVRVIVELSVSSPGALNLSHGTEGATLRNKIIGMLRHLDPNIENPSKRDRELVQAFLEASDLGLQYLHAFVHNPSVNPDQHLARRFSSAFRPFLERVDAVL
jgi:hypothetical protein